MSNIELRTMNEENNPGTGLEIIESEVELREWRIVGENTLVEKNKSSHGDWYNNQWRQYFRSKWNFNI